MAEEFDLQRFVAAQAPVMEQVLAELREGHKRTHWMWFVFPQLRGLGNSPAAHHYGISGRREAAAYLAHPVLGPRLVRCTALVNGHRGRSAERIFGVTDAMKFRSCMTLFAEVAPEEPLFRTALERYFPDGPDPRTLARLATA